MAVTRRSPFVTFILQHPFPENCEDRVQLLYPSIESIGAMRLYSHVQVDSSKPIYDMLLDYCIQCMIGTGIEARMNTVEVLNTLIFAVIDEDGNSLIVSDWGEGFSNWGEVWDLSELNYGIAVWCPDNTFYNFYLSITQQL